jgi:hypothetical protein
VTKRHLAALFVLRAAFTLSAQSAHGDVTVCITFPPLLSIGVITFYYSISLMIINNRGSSLELPVALLCWPGINSIESYRRHVNGEKIGGGGGGHWATCVYRESIST